MTQHYWDTEILVTDENFDEAAYLAANPDVANAVAAKLLPSGRRHFELFGRSERRCHFQDPAGMDALRATKTKRIEPILRLEMPHCKHGLKFDFLTPSLRATAAISETENISSHWYDGHMEGLIRNCQDGLVLDCGAGKPKRYYANVVNYEIVNYDTTDVIGVGEELPFKNDVFDAVVSNAVLEHVRDPFACAKELVRVLKPGGRLICCVPFLQPLHGYPNHYYNMSHQGLRALFEGHLVIDDHKVTEATLPVWSLTWIVQRWAAGLPQNAREEFLDMPVRTLMSQTEKLLDRSWVKQLPIEMNFELASATMLFASKPHRVSVGTTGS
jgi:SAM-dependent methyltransferase